MLNFGEKVKDIIKSWNEDYPQDPINPDFGDYAASILRDATEAQFSD